MAGHLRHGSGVYWFRRRVPDAPVERLGSGESLRTSNSRTAATLAKPEGPTGQHAGWCASGIDRDGTFDARLAAVDRVWPRCRSTHALIPFRPNKRAVQRSPTPVDLLCGLQVFQKHPVQRHPDLGLAPVAHASPAAHARPAAISAGSISHGRPDLSTNRMPVSAARSGRRGLPPFGLGGSGGGSGVIAARNAPEPVG